MKPILIIFLLLLLGGAGYWVVRARSGEPLDGSRTTRGGTAEGSVRSSCCGVETSDHTQAATNTDGEGEGEKASLPPKIEDDEGKKKKDESPVISKEKAEELARKEIEGKINIPPNTPVEVLANEDGNLVVTFKTVLNPGERGADYHAQVTVDGKTGKILNILAGS